MPRKPSAATPRSETTAELIARISAERDAPVTRGSGYAGPRGVSVLDAPVRSRNVRLPAQRGPASALPRQRRAEPPPFSDDVLADPVPDDTPTVSFGVVAPIAPRRHGLTHRLLPIALGAAAMIAISVYTANGFALPDFTDPGPRAGDTGDLLVREPGPVDQAVPEPGPTGPTVPAPAPPEDAAVAGPPGTPSGPTVPAPAPSGGTPEVRLTDAPVPGN